MKNQVVLALGADARAPEAELLDQMSTLDFATGLRAMGIDEHEAFRLAGICCRSVVVFSRLDARGSVDEPAWSKNLELTPLILCGGWDASNKHDRTVVAELCQKTYDEVDLDARKFAAMPDAPLDLEGSVWTVRSPKDAFTLIGPMVGDATSKGFAMLALPYSPRLTERLRCRMKSSPSFQQEVPTFFIRNGSDVD